MKEHPYCYPNTDIYRNRLDIRDSQQLERYERLQTAMRLETIPKNFPITPHGYRRIHHYILQDVYDWAGEYHRIDTGREGAPFCRADYIAQEMEKRFAMIHAENDLRNLTASQFAMRSAVHVSELNAIHPFLDGNGRTLRAFLEILATEAGHKIDIVRIDPEEWNRASIISFRQSNYSLMAKVIDCCVILQA